MKKDIVFVFLQNASPLGEKKHYVNDDYSVCGARHFQNPGFNIVAIRGIIITQQLPFIFSMCKAPTPVGHIQ